MASRERETSNQILQNQHITLLELLDRLLDKGIMAQGDIVLSVADIDLVYLNLGLLLSSVKTVEHLARKGSVHQKAEETRHTHFPEEREVLNEFQVDAEKEAADTTFSPTENDQTINGEEIVTPSSTVHSTQSQIDEPRANIDPKNVEKGLAKLVLALVDLIRKLMEKQAIRRIEADQLSTEEIEKVGTAFLLLDEKMGELKRVFDLADEDLNLDLGPLGNLF